MFVTQAFSVIGRLLGLFAVAAANIVVLRFFDAYNCSRIQSAAAKSSASRSFPSAVTAATAINTTTMTSAIALA